MKASKMSLEIASRIVNSTMKKLRFLLKTKVIWGLLPCSTADSLCSPHCTFMIISQAGWGERWEQPREGHQTHIGGIRIHCLWVHHPVPDVTTYSKHAPKTWRSTMCTRWYWWTKMKKRRTSFRTCWDALSLSWVLCSGKRNFLLPLSGVVYLYGKWRWFLPSRGIQKLN